MIPDARILQPIPESGARVGCDGAKQRCGSTVPSAVDTLGHLLALRVTVVNEQERGQVAALVARMQVVTRAGGHRAGLRRPGLHRAVARGIQMEVVRLPEAKRGFVLLPRRWMVERNFGWATHFRRLARDYERLPETLAGLQVVAFATLVVSNAIAVLVQSA